MSTTVSVPATDARHDSAATRASSRDRYIDTLRAVALLRVVTYHQFGWHWLPVAYPSMGIMFALAGGLVARSLTRAEGDYWTVLGRRMRRLLPPVWLFGLVIIPIMVVHGWTATAAGGGDPLSQWRLFLFWLVPIADPPGSDWGYDFVLPLWYIRAYLWLLLLSPALLFLFRRWPKRVLAVPLGIVAAAALGVIDLSTGRAAAALLDFGIYGACWMLGFAHEDGRIRTVRSWVVVPAGLGLLAGGLAWAVAHQTGTGWDIDNIPAAAALYSLGAVLLLMRFYPSFTWMARFPALDSTVAVISNRAMTIYLWHNVAIFLAVPVLDSNRLTANLDRNTAAGDLARFATALLLTLAAIFLFGWVEDLAARRRPLRFNPWPRSTGRAEVAPLAPRRSRFAPLRDRPVLLGAGLVVAAAATTGAALWPWSHDLHRSTAGSIGKAVTPYPGIASTQGPPTMPRPSAPAPVSGRPAGGSPAPPGTAPSRPSTPSPYLVPGGPSGTGTGSTSAAPPSSAGAAPSSSAPQSSPTPTPTGSASSAPASPAPASPAPTAPTTSPAPATTSVPTSTLTPSTPVGGTTLPIPSGP